MLIVRDDKGNELNFSKTHLANLIEDLEIKGFDLIVEGPMLRSIKEHE